MAQDDELRKPAHYNKGIECLAYIESHELGFSAGNVIKYVTRYRHKGTPLEDLKKARVYLDRLIARVEHELRDTTGVYVAGVRVEKLGAEPGRVSDAKLAELAETVRRS